MADLRTVHVRPGSDIKAALAEAGIEGDFLEFSDPYACGPLAPVFDTQAIAARSAWLAERLHLEDRGVPPLQPMYDALEGLGPEDQVTLWFEHDPYDMLALAYVLSRMGAAGGPKPESLHLIHIEDHPNHPRFVGMGQLSPEELKALWSGSRTLVTKAQMELGTEAWSLLATEDMCGLAALAASGTPALPAMGKALVRFLADLPNTRCGLTLTEGLTLAVVEEHGTISGGKIFSQLMRADDPLPYLGDLMYWPILEGMASGSGKLLASEGEDDEPHRRTYSLTDAGRAVLAGISTWPHKSHWTFEPTDGSVVGR